MRVAVAGGTGVVGSQVVRALGATGHEAVVLARGRGVDLVTGAGLDRALVGVEAVVDVSNVTTLSRRRSTAFFSTVTNRLLETGSRGSVRHHVVLSIVGIDRVDTGYYAGKRAQEELVRSGPLPHTVLRSTQFHEFAEQLLTRTRGPVVLVPRMRTQPVAAAEVADRLVALATASPGGSVPEMAGPGVEEVDDLVRRVARHTGQRRRVLSVPVPGAGRALATGGLLPAGDVTLGRIGFAEWLAGSPGA